ncbi:Cytochrome P450 4V2 [Halotydeus destructor]|nr:Cytochrome P450 4V2 [Halotydeus destructor]
MFTGKKPHENTFLVDERLNKEYGQDGAETISKVLTCRTNLDKPLEYHLLDKWIGDGLLISDGAKWKPNRKLLTPAFHSKVIEEFVPVINRHAQVLCDILGKQISCEDFVKMSMNCAFDIILETSMGYQKFSQGQDGENEYQKSLSEYCRSFILRSRNPLVYNDFVYYYLTPSGRRAKQLVDKMHSITEQVIADRKKVLIGKLESDPYELKKVETFTFAGFDTSALAIGYVVFHLGHAPLVQEKLFNEITEVVGEDPDREISLDHLSRLTYLEMVIKESLRLNPAVPTIVRKLSEPIEINGHLIPKDISVFMKLHLLHRDARYFPEPDEFNPERFSPAQVDKIPPYAYVPFSSGARNCIGQKFAMNEMKIVVAHIVRRFKIKSLVTIAELRLVNGIVMKPTRPMTIQFTPRN